MTRDINETIVPTAIFLHVFAIIYWFVILSIVFICLVSKRKLFNNIVFLNRSGELNFEFDQDLKFKYLLVYDEDLIIATNENIIVTVQPHNYITYVIPAEAGILLIVHCF